MIIPPPGSLSIIPWARQGLAGAAAVDKTATARAGRLELPVRLTVNARANVDVAVRFHGPGDVVGLDARQVLRTSPAAGAGKFEPNLFPLVEFDAPDLPWLFSPTGPDGQRWQPWLVLAVLPAALGQFQADARPLPRLTCPVAELPAISEAWAWAHAQVVQGTGGDTAGALLASARQSLSRLLAPRRLDPRTAYIACVVPTYDVGRKAGLGEPVTASDLTSLSPAWPEPATAAPGTRATLPVYYSWEFSTGSVGDFEALAREVAVIDAPAEVGRQTVDTSRPGWGMAPTTATDPTAALELQGALRPVGRAPVTWPAGPMQAFRARLRGVLETPAAQTPQGPVPLIGPPLYGQTYARVSSLPAEGQPPVWLRELSLSPDQRIAAGLGVQIVRFEQEALMAAAWDQLAARQRDNEQRKRVQLAEEVNAAMTKETSAAAARAPVRSAALRRRERPGTAARRATARVAAAPAAPARAVARAFARNRVGPRQPVFQLLQPLPAAAPTELETFAPTFDTPASELLRDYFPDFLLPGLDRIPPGSIVLLEANPQFVEAFLVGLNHELVRELVWRGYPTDQRGTSFRSFWRRPSGTDGDIAPIASWDPASAIGTHGAGTGDRRLVLLLRSELLQRFPRTGFVARQARWNPDGVTHDLDAAERQPLFRITRPPDVVLLGFDLTLEQARGDDKAPGSAGWFFVLQEQPSEPRFGLDVAASYGGRPASWGDLSWGHLVTRAEDLSRLRYVPLAPLNGVTLPLEGTTATATFGASSAHMAFITRELPFTLAVHARTWL